MEQQFLVREYRQGDETAIVSLLSEVFMEKVAWTGGAGITGLDLPARLY
ncbi:MAG: hypothetical protein AB1497_07415 [Bacillota bacterium]